MINRRNLFHYRNRYEEFIELRNAKKSVIQPAGSKEIRFRITPDEKKAYTLRFTGNVQTPRDWRNEYSVDPEYHIAYRRLSESLEDLPGGEELLLRMSNSIPDIARCAYYKIYGDEAEGAGEYTFSFAYQTSQDAVLTDFAVTLEVFYHRPGEARVYGPDAEIQLSVPLEKGEGFTEICRTVSLEREPDFAVVSIMGLAFTGEVRIRAPKMVKNGRNIILPFVREPRILASPRWIGENLSQIEQPYFEIRINGELIFSGTHFDRTYQYPAYEFKIPEGVLREGENRAVIRYAPDYYEPYSFQFLKGWLVARPKDMVVAYNRYVRRGTFAVLIKTGRDHTAVQCSSPVDTIRALTPEFTAQRAGLHVLRFECSGPFPSGTQLAVTIGEERHPVRLSRYLIREEDRVLAGTGDSVYINLDRESFVDFLSWYFGNDLGNMLTFRTTYRWSGSTYAPEAFWSELAGILGGMEVPYAIMTDGRELNSANTNAQGFREDAPFYLGRQSHEQDGAFYYWNPAELKRGEEFFYELTGKRFQNEGMLPCGYIVRRDGKYFKHYDNRLAQNMEQAVAYFQQNTRRIHCDSRRHTGPSLLFKYFYQNGVEWLGAELMYSTLAFTNAALRGVSRAYGRDSYGGHIAIQWSNAPHQSVYRYRRYLYALYTCYMNGLDQINTEEGLWRFEAYNARYERDSEACMNHAGAQARLVEFIRTHSRRGELHTNIAFVQGKYDGFTLFSNGNIWGRDGWPTAAPEKSWEAIKVFYPGARMKNVYVYPCFPVQQGFFTNDPYGDVDLVPAEAEAAAWSRYRYLIMGGWNTADEAFGRRMLDYVRSGGTLLLTWAHLYTTTDREEAISHRAQILFNEDIRELTGIRSADFSGEVPRLETELGTAEAQVVENSVGEGRVILVNSKCYPSEKPIRELYTSLVRQIAQENKKAEAPYGWVSCDGWIYTAAYDAPDRRTFYLLDVRWWKRNPRPLRAVLHMGDAECGFPVRRDVLNVLTMFDGVAVLTADNTTDILSCEDGRLTLQGEGRTRLVLFKWVNGEIEIQEKVLNLDGITTENF